MSRRPAGSWPRTARVARTVRRAVLRVAPGAALCAGLWGAPATAAPGAAGLLDFTPAERSAILAHGPWPPAPAPDPSNRAQPSPAAQTLGRTLFFERRLSAEARLSCASCHVPARGFQDGRPTARGLADGVRNTPGLMDTAGQRWYGWDGATDSLWAASLRPIVDPAEMGGSAAATAALLRRDARLRRLYEAAFGPPPADDEAVLVDAAKALAAWQATLVSPRTAFDDFRDALARGDAAAAARYPLAAQRGLRLFVGEGRCSACHAGARFTHGEFADIGLPFFVPGGVDPGRHGGIRALRDSRFNRLGDFSDEADPARPSAVATRHVALQHRNFGEFKVPGLRQLAHTAPYFHAGTAATLADVVRHYSEVDEDRLHADGERLVRPLKLTPTQAADLEAFLRSLSTPPAAGADRPAR